MCASFLGLLPIFVNAFIGECIGSVVHFCDILKIHHAESGAVPFAELRKKSVGVRPRRIEGNMPFDPVKGNVVLFDEIYQLFPKLPILHRFFTACPPAVGAPLDVPFIAEAACDV